MNDTGEMITKIRNHVRYPSFMRTLKPIETRINCGMPIYRDMREKVERVFDRLFKYGGGSDEVARKTKKKVR